MKDVACDVAIIGAGTAGLSARSAVRDAGASSLLIESGPGGTTCARTGCMPSKLLIAAAGAAHAIRSAGLFGIDSDAPRIDGARVMARVRAERDRFVAGVLRGVERIPDSERAHGHARFVAPNVLEIDDHTRVAARAVVIATGSHSHVPAFLDAVAARVLTSETVFECPTLPGSLAVIGAGPLGLELGQAFARLGVRVKVFDGGHRVAGLHDDKVAQVARKLLGDEMPLVLGATLTAEPAPDGVALGWRSNTEEGRETFDYVLAAAGRPPNVTGLGLAAAGIALDAHGVPRFDSRTRQCGDSPIFIAGDADHERAVLHEAANEGRVAGLNAAHWPTIAAPPRDVAFTITYTDPEIAAIGPPPPDDALIGETDLRHSGRARVQGRNVGLMRVYAEGPERRLTGGTLIGPDMEHVGHLLAWAVQLGLTAEDLLALPFYHPTLEESLRGAVREICKQIRVGGMRAENIAFGPGA